MHRLIASSIAFFGGFAVMVLEIVGVRYLAVDFGGSFYVWISQIGVIMIALALGYAVGGALADLWKRASPLMWMLIISGVYTALIPTFARYPIDWIVMRHPMDRGIPLIWQKLDPALGSALIFLGPCLVLAMISPFMIRLTTQQLTHVGRVSGSIVSASTIGSIMGVFVSGYILIDLLPLSRIFWVTGGLMVLLGLSCLGVSPPTKNT